MIRPIHNHDVAGGVRGNPSHLKTLKCVELFNAADSKTTNISSRNTGISQVSKISQIKSPNISATTKGNVKIMNQINI